MDADCCRERTSPQAKKGRRRPETRWWPPSQWIVHVNPHKLPGYQATKRLCALATRQSAHQLDSSSHSLTSTSTFTLPDLRCTSPRILVFAAPRPDLSAGHDTFLRPCAVRRSLPPSRPLSSSLPTLGSGSRPFSSFAVLYLSPYHRQRRVRPLAHLRRCLHLASRLDYYISNPLLRPPSPLKHRHSASPLGPSSSLHDRLHHRPIARRRPIATFSSPLLQTRPPK